jgi:hypothetical protein
VGAGFQTDSPTQVRAAASGRRRDGFPRSGGKWARQPVGGGRSSTLAKARRRGHQLALQGEDHEREIAANKEVDGDERGEQSEGEEKTCGQVCHVNSLRFPPEYAEINNA